MPHCLIVEDDPDDAALTARSLEGMTSTTVASPAEAWAQLRRAQEQGVPTDLIVLDIWLGDEDGIDLLGELKADASTARIPVLVVSGNDDPSVIEEAYARHAAGYVVKPDSLEEYQSALRSASHFWSKTRRP